MKSEEVYDLKARPNFLEVNYGKDNTAWNIDSQQGDKKVYTYDEAIDLAGNGWYIYTLLVVLSLALSGMGLDMFGFSMVVTSACDLELTHVQESVLLSVPFLGSVLMSYPWGYIADTQGRLKGLTISLWGSFILASLSAFSPNWIILAVLRFSSSSLSSGILSLSTTLLGESSSSKLKGPCLIGVNIFLFSTFGISTACAYFVLNFEFAVDLGFIVFTPWRLLTLVLALPLGISAALLSFFFESPKFLLNEGDQINALKILRRISERNGVTANKYPVQRVILNEMTSLRRKDTPFLQSLMDQIIPLFKPPLLHRNLLLSYIVVVVYSHNNGFFSWIPYIIIYKFDFEYDDNITANNFCGIISKDVELNVTSTCIGKVNDFTMWVNVTEGAIYSLLIVVVLSLSRWKKTVHISVLVISFGFGVALPHVPGRILSVILFFVVLTDCLCMPIIFSYYVDMFPTSHRGMAACLGVMVARISALVGTNLVGAFIESHCINSYYSWSAFTISGAIVSIFLPPDKPKK